MSKNMMDFVMAAIAVGAVAVFWSYYGMNESSRLPALNTADAKALVNACTKQGLLDYQDPPCLIKQGDRVYGFSMLVTGTVATGPQGVASSYTSSGKNNFTVNIPTYSKFPRGEHFFREHPRWDELWDTYRKGGRLADNSTD